MVLFFQNFKKQILKTGSTLKSLKIGISFCQFTENSDLVIWLIWGKVSHLTVKVMQKCVKSESSCQWGDSLGSNESNDSLGVFCEHEAFKMGMGFKIWVVFKSNQIETFLLAFTLINNNNTQYIKPDIS